MMPRLQASILIDKSAEDIFTFFSVPENHARFIPGMREFKQTSPGPLGQPGATMRGVRQDFGVRTEVRYEITRYEPNHALGMKGAMGPLSFEDGYVLEPSGNNTRVNFWLEFRLTGLMKLARPFVALVGRTHAAETLANLKKVVETEK
jgi:carbon monoxide dehydrogenase subunit G